MVWEQLPYHTLQLVDESSFFDFLNYAILNPTGLQN